MPFTLDLREQIYVALVGVFVTSLIVADLVAGKYFVMAGYEMSAGTVTFPVAFILTDIVNEYYGKRGARFMTGVGMAMLVLAFLLIAMARVLPPSPGTFIPEDSFQAVFGMAPRLIFASLTAYLISQIVDIHTFATFKRITESKHLWARAIGSTLISQIVDTAVVTFGVMVGSRGFGEIASVAATQYFYKILVAIALTPLCYIAHDVITRRLGIDPHPHGDEPDEAKPAASTKDG
ncbi:MAG: queuosine precursor transporter [Deltaproteobacteria bacterium]|nr:queuosine precursor transporter [Deltaproteobacteria bacterium]